MIIEIKTADEFDSYVKNGKKCVIDFWATWCSPCKALGGVIESLEKIYPNVNFLKVNVEALPNISSRYFVTGLPAVFFLKDGRVVKQIIGSADKSKISSILNEDMA